MTSITHDVYAVIERAGAYWLERWTPGLPLDWATHSVAAARTVRVPTLVVRGATSDVLSEDGVRELLETIPHAEAATPQGPGADVAGRPRGDQRACNVLGRS